MGFTRYLEGEIKITPQLVEDVNQIITTSGVTITGPDGEGTPIVTVDEISINGSAADGEDYESFTIKPGMVFSFCKTARNPYDLVVGAIVQRVAETTPNVTGSSDGGHDEDKIAELYSKIFT